MDTGQLMEVTRGFREARIVLSGVESGLLQQLSHTERSAEDLARENGYDLRACRILLNALAALGVLSLREERYTVAEGLRDALNPDHPDSVINSLWHTARLWKLWSGLSEVLKTGRPEYPDEDHPEQTQHFIGAMKVGARAAAAELVSQVDLHGVQKLLDLGGGPASYAVAFARRKPDLTAVVFDLPQVEPIARMTIEEEAMQDRISYKAGSFLEDDLGGPYDLVWVSSIVHMLNDAQNRELIRKAADTLNSGGRVVVRDFLMDEQGPGPAHSALFAVNMLVATEGGQTYRASEIADWLEGAGLTQIQVQNAGMNGLVTGTKP